MAESDSVFSATPPASGESIQGILSWLQICENEHTCVAEMKTRQSPTWLIDTKYKYIVRGADQRYIALSYTWQVPFPLSQAVSKYLLQLGRETLSTL